MGMTIRVASLAAVTYAAGCCAEDLVFNKTVDVVIVGAGWSGMAAADSLARANVSFLVLESSNRTGGRTHAITFGHSDVWRGVIERGRCELHRKQSHMNWCRG